MLIDKILLDKLMNQAKENIRLRQAYNHGRGVEYLYDESSKQTDAIYFEPKSGIGWNRWRAVFVILECKDEVYMPFADKDILA
ncbi:hypothetical protein [Bacteroides thetaiotaomicron]|jgi:hypothetical protein|uniref:hypothetical protein n=1 Tax=Bacteroides thetaiotaomicron TaxID=818 RepID=UPI0021654379|nr:hypothetical protein [Bacteroides thetaiotaomicron]MCS2715190.1 hypothetical protein [Bacteroides thetaiotaomicron]MCS2875487.1 hypothetical protein [Bacteroides thetaiotaomicron]